MKIGLPSNGFSLSNSLPLVFERCRYFIIIDLDKQEMVVPIMNDAQTVSRGVEIQVVQLLVDNQVEIIITPEIEERTLYALQIAGIEVYLAIAGTIQENIDAYRQGRLVETKIALNPSEPDMNFFLLGTNVT